MHTVLRATSATLQEFLRQGMVADPGLVGLFDTTLGGKMQVSLNTPEEMESNSLEGVSVWLYRIERDDQCLNAPPTRPTPTQLAPTPLPLRLHYLVTPIVAIDSAFPLVSPGREQEILGKVMQLFYDMPVLRGAALRDTLTGSDQRIVSRLEPMSLEEITRIWNALERPYQLSVSYEVTNALIAPEAQPTVVTPVRIAEPVHSVVVDEEPA